MSAMETGNSPYAGVDALVLGASGFIGRWVVRALVASDARVHLGVRDGTLAADLFQRHEIRGGIQEVDLGRERDITDIIAATRPQVTFNLAGYGIDRTERDESAGIEINERLPGLLGDILSDKCDSDWPGASLVHVGSALEYGRATGNLVETTRPEPDTLYGTTKLAGTRRLAAVCDSTGLRGVTARLFTVYGPGEHAGRLLPALLEATRTGAVLPLTEGAQRRDFTYVRDVADGLLGLGRAAARPGEIINLATGLLTSVRVFAETAGRVLGVDEHQLQFGALPTRSEEMQHDAVCVDRLRDLTGWTPQVGIEEGVRRTLRLSGE